MVFRSAGAFPSTMVVGGLLVGLGGCAGLAPPPVQAQEQAQLPSPTAETWAARADSLRTRRDVDAALRAYRRARALYQRAGALARAAEMTGDIGVMHWLRNRYDEALAAFRAARKQAGTSGNRAEVADNLVNIGLVHKNQGRYEQALRCYRKALAIHRERGDQTGAAVVLNNVGEIYRRRGQPRKALSPLRASLRIHRARPDSLRMSINLVNLSFVQMVQGQYPRALESGREALAISRSLGNRYGEANALNMIGNVQLRRNQYEASRRSYRRSLSLNRRLGRRSEVARLHNNIGVLLEVQDERGEALVHYQEALAINRDLGHQSRMARNLSKIGHIHFAENRLAAADSTLRASVRLTSALVRSAGRGGRRNYLSKTISRFHTLVSIQVRRGRPDSALQVLERTRALIPSGRLSGADSSARFFSDALVPSTETLQRALAPDEAVVQYANASTVRPLVAVVVRADTIYAQEIPRSLLNQTNETFERGLLHMGRRTALGRLQGGALRETQQSGGAARKRDDRLADLVHLYRHDLAVASPFQVLSTARRQRLGKYLYAMLLQPIMDGLAGVEDLVIVPDGVLGYLPFETLPDWEGTPLVMKMPVRYAQSLRAQRRLRNRARVRPTAEAGLLALGDVRYAGSSPLAQSRGYRRPPDVPPRDSAWAISLESEARLYRPGLVESEAQQMDYEQLGYRPSQWTALPGTRREVRRLRKISGTAQLLTREAASERTLQRWSRTGRLKNFRVLHFATHGLVSPARPSLSALVLSEVGASEASPAEDSLAGAAPDGYLNAREIASMDLNAEFVALSSCRSGLGRAYRGSGVTGLAQSFLEAGARSTAVSLWAVYDAATGRFMEAFYRRAWGTDTSWAEALTETKRAFASGKHGERLQDPRFWAPFVHYGWEGR